MQPPATLGKYTLTRMPGQGAAMYPLLTGHLPFPAQSLPDHCQMHFNQAFPRGLAEHLRMADDRFAKLAN